LSVKGSLLAKHEVVSDKARKRPRQSGAIVETIGPSGRQTGW
jgi:hypothetical protein